MVQYELSCYEIGGNEPVDQIYPGQIIDADAILLVFSLGSPDAIQQLRFYQARLAQLAPDVPMFLVGMKTDTGGQEGEQRLTTEIENMAHNWGSRGFWRTSVRTGLNAQRILTSITALPRSAGKTALKLIFAGPAGAGKTALIMRLANGVLNGTYTPTVGTQVTTVKIDAPAPTLPVEKDKEKVPANPEELRPEGVVVEKLAVSNFDSTKVVAPPEAQHGAPPSVLDKAVPSAPVIRDEVSQDLSRLKTIQRDLPPLAAAPAIKTPAPPPGAPRSQGAPQSAGTQESMMRDLQTLLDRKKTLSEVSGEKTLPPSGPVTPSAVSAQQPLSDGVAQPPSGSEMQEPIELGTKDTSSAPPAVFAGKSSQPEPMTKGSGAFAEGEQRRSETPPATDTPHTLTTPPTPPLLPSASEEADHRIREDVNQRGKKVKHREREKLEKKSKEKIGADDAEDISEIDTTPGGQSLARSVPASTVTVERVLERKTTVFYRKQMNPLTRNKLSVVLSTLKIYEQLKLQTVVPAERVGGEKTLKIRELSPFVYAEPIFPGCICVPAQMPLDARKDSDTADFHITPLATGPIMDACVRLYYEGKLVDTIQTPTKVVNQTSAKVSTLAAVAFPVFGPLFDERIGPFLASVIPFWEQIGGIQNFFLMIAGALGFFGTIMYYIHRPKQATPIEANFPELQQFLEEDVKRPDLAEVLKEKGEIEKSQNI